MPGSPSIDGEELIEHLHQNLTAADVEGAATSAAAASRDITGSIVGMAEAAQNSASSMTISRVVATALAAIDNRCSY